MHLSRFRHFPRRGAWALAAATLSLAVLAAAAPAAAGSGDRPLQFELAASTLGADGASPEQIFGFRASRLLSPRWAVEGGLFRLTDESIWLGDLSAKLFLRSGRRTNLFVSGGPSLLRIPDTGSYETLVHLGLGAEVDVSRHLYLRPEVRGRWVAEDLDAISIFDLSLGLGWRF